MEYPIMRVALLLASALLAAPLIAQTAAAPAIPGIADPARVQPIRTEDYPVPAPRPAYSVLSPRAWEEAGLPVMPEWRESLREAFRLYGSSFRPAT